MCYRVVVSLQLKRYTFNLFLFSPIQLANKYWAPHVKKKLSFESKVNTSTGVLLGCKRMSINLFLMCPLPVVLILYKSIGDCLEDQLLLNTL